MKAAVFTVEYRVKDLGWGREPIPPEFRSSSRLSLFHELIKIIHRQKVDLAVLPGGFFRTDSPGGIINGLKYRSPEINVLVGWDNVAGNKREVWVIAKNGSITKRIPEAWISPRKFSAEILSQADRRFQINNKMYSAYCCGDVIIDKRRFTYSKAAFVLAHSSAPGRSFTPAMRKLQIPVFLSHHVKNPSIKNNEYFAYNGKKDLEPKTELEGKFQGTKCKKLKWMARVYSV